MEGLYTGSFFSGVSTYLKIEIPDIVKIIMKKIRYLYLIQNSFFFINSKLI